MFVNKRVTSWNPDRNHKIDETVTKVGEILMDMELFSQCRWLSVCDIDCCMYQCQKCSVNAMMINVLQDCYIKLKEIQRKKEE